MLEPPRPPLSSPPPRPATPPATTKLSGKSLSSRPLLSPPPSRPEHSAAAEQDQDLRVKRSGENKPAKFFKGAKKGEKQSLAPAASTASAVTVPQLNGKHSEHEEEEQEEKVPSSAKKRKKGEKRAKSKAVVDTESEDASENEVETTNKPLTVEANPPVTKSPTKATAVDNIPNDFRYDPKNLSNKPKGLVDALSSFFTPGLKRTSRTAMNSLLKPETVQKESPLAATPKTDEGKKVRLSVEEKEATPKNRDANEDAKNDERKRHASAGQQQVKSLYDGLSHLYADCDSRLRSAPNSEKGVTGKGEEKEDEEEEEEEEGEKEGEEDKEEGSKRVSSPNRLSDGEGSKDKEEAGGKKEDKEKPEEGDKAKGTSKDNVDPSCTPCLNVLHPFVKESMG